MKDIKPKISTPKKEMDKVWVKELGRLLRRASKDYHRREEEIYRATMQDHSF